MRRPIQTEAVTAAIAFARSLVKLATRAFAETPAFLAGRPLLAFAITRCFC
jgi:hypothetical protein